VEIADPRLIGETLPSLSIGVLAVANWLFNGMPNVLWRLLFESPSPEPIQLSASEKLRPSTPALSDSSLAPVDSQTKSYREMTVTRRYGNE
jgi:hypothetical protein